MKRALAAVFIGSVMLSSVGCATMPVGPSVMVLPSPGKPFDMFMSEDATCRRYAQQAIGLTPQQTVTQGATTGAVIGTIAGAGLGAVIGSTTGKAGSGAATGAVIGGLVGTAEGASEGYYYGYEAQRRYDIAYIQCMYSYGNQVPGGTTRGYRSAPPPPPPPMR